MGTDRLLSEQHLTGLVERPPNCLLVLSLAGALGKFSTHDGPLAASNFVVGKYSVTESLSLGLRLLLRTSLLGLGLLRSLLQFRFVNSRRRDGGTRGIERRRQQRFAIVAQR